MKVGVLVASCVLLMSCSGKNNVPPEIIQPKKMQLVLWDVIKAQELSGVMARKDSSINEIEETKSLTQKVYEIHNITSGDFDKSYLWYTEHPELMRTIFDSMTVQSERQKEQRIKDGYKPFKGNTLKKIKDQ